MKKRKLSFQKIFNFVSLIFLVTCSLFYGGRFVKLYLENKKQVVEETNTLGKSLKDNNSETLKNINGEYYFTGEVDNNYVLYSGIMFRVIKIGNNNVITMISDNSITLLAFGEVEEYTDSMVNTWLNKTDKEGSGILEKNLNSMISYLKSANICTDKIDDVSKSNCTNYDNEYYLSSLSISDYINTGASSGFINTKENFYLDGMTSNNEVWYVTSEGKINKNKGNEIYGIKPVLILKENMELIGGTGTKDDPYTIESVLGTFGSYVKLGEDTWRVIDVNDNNVKLMLDDYLKSGNDTVSYKYSQYTSYHDDTKYGTLAYYLKNTYLNSLSYKDLVIETNYANGYYGKDNNFDYTDTLKKTVNTKVASISIGDIILNHELNNYFTMTSSTKSNKYVYTIQSDNTPYSKIVSSTSKVVPVITISKDKLTSGTGSKNDPLKVGE